MRAIYYRLATISELKVIIAGLLVSVGAMIGWFAAGGGLSLTLPVVAVVFFVWEIGGRNIPNDFSDMQQDKRLGIKTVPLVHGAVTASMLIFIFAFMTVAANALLATTSLIYAASTSLIGIALLIFPALSLRKNPVPAEALKYFNKASFYPLFLFGTLVAAYVMAVY